MVPCSVSSHGLWVTFLSTCPIYILIFKNDWSGIEIFRNGYISWFLCIMMNKQEIYVLKILHCGSFRKLSRNYLYHVLCHMSTWQDILWMQGNPFRGSHQLWPAFHNEASSLSADAALFSLSHWDRNNPSIVFEGKKIFLFWLQLQILSYFWKKL